MSLAPSEYVTATISNNNNNSILNIMLSCYEFHLKEHITFEYRQFSLTELEKQVFE